MAKYRLACVHLVPDIASDAAAGSQGSEDVCNVVEALLGVSTIDD